jgi:hypothetical protein
LFDDSLVTPSGAPPESVRRCLLKFGINALVRDFVSSFSSEVVRNFHRAEKIFCSIFSRAPRFTET